MTYRLSASELMKFRTMLKDHSTVLEIFETLKQNHENSIKYLKELSSTQGLPDNLRSELFSSEMTMVSSLKIMEFVEMLFLNTSFLYEQLDGIMNIISGMSNDSSDVKKAITELHEKLELSKKPDKKGLLQHFAYDLSSFDINAGLFKGHFEKKKF